MRLIACLFFVFFTPLFTVGQQTFKLKKDCKIDTLYVSLQQNDTADVELQRELYHRFDSIVSAFNSQPNRAFTIAVDSTHKINSINFMMGKVSYVSCKRSTVFTIINVVLLGIDILIIPYFPPILPFYLMPSTYCKVDLSCTPDLFIKTPKLYVNPTGYLTKKGTQKARFKRNFDKKFLKFFNEIDKQYKKNNK